MGEFEESVVISMNTIQFITGAVIIISGLIVEALAILGIYIFKFGLNRMHSAAIGDTLGMGLICFGICIISGFSVTTLKIIIVIFCFWLAGPVSSHLLARLEITTNRHIDEHAKQIDLRDKKQGDDYESI